MSLEDFGNLARCNGLFVEIFRPVITTESVEGEIKKWILKRKEREESPNILKHNHPPNSALKIHAGVFSIFQAALVCCCRRDTIVLVVNYNRKMLQQTGLGHFSPIGGYLSEEGSERKSKV